MLRAHAMTVVVVLTGLLFPALAYSLRQAPDWQEQAIQQLKDGYAAYNRGDIAAVVRNLDPQIEWTEPPEFPDGGTYRGIDAVTTYLRKSREAWTDGAFEPERFLVNGDTIVVLVKVRIREKGSEAWSESLTGDAWRFRNGRPYFMRAFTTREEALKWAGIAEGETGKR